MISDKRDVFVGGPPSPFAAPLFYSKLYNQKNTFETTLSITDIYKHFSGSDTPWAGAPANVHARKPPGHLLQT